MSTLRLKKTPRTDYPYMVMGTNPAVLRAIIFDCDGVLVDSESLHFAAIKEVLAGEGASLTRELYDEKYLAFDDRGAFSKIFEDFKKPLSFEKLDQLMKSKTEIFQKNVKTKGLLPFPAVPELVMAVAQRYPLAIASGSRREELDLILDTTGLRGYFGGIVSADDVKQGKPHAESYLKAVEVLNAGSERQLPITPGECVVIEDSREGVLSAHSAGMKCIAVASSYPTFELSSAELVVDSIGALKVSQIEDLFHQQAPVPSPSPQSN